MKTFMKFLEDVAAIGSTTPTNTTANVAKIDLPLKLGVVRRGNPIKEKPDNVSTAKPT